MDEAIKTLLLHAQALREAGVLRLTCFDVSVEFAPLAYMSPEQEDAAAAPLPPGRDPVTHGFPEGTHMPTLRERMSQRG